MRLGVSEVVAHSWLKPFIAAFAQALPSVRVELTVELSRDLLERMQDGELDLCFQTESRPIPGLGFLELDQHAFVWVASADSPQSEMTVSEALAHHSLFLPAKGTQPYVEFQTYITRFGLDAPSLVPSSNLSVAQNLVRDGLGFGLLPLCMVRADIAARRLRAMEYDWLPEPLLSSARFSEERKPVLVERALETAQAVAL